MIGVPYKTVVRKEKEMEGTVKFPISAIFMYNEETGKMETVSTKYVEISENINEMYWKGIMAQVIRNARVKNEQR